MERLTEKRVFDFYNPGSETTTVCVDDYTQIVERTSDILAEYVVNPKPHYYLVGKAVDKLAEYEDLEERGMLLRLPCKLGTKVYYVRKCIAPSCKECKGFLKVNNCYCDYKARIFEQEFDYRHLKAFGISIFLTKEAAEAALKEMEK